MSKQLRAVARGVTIILMVLGAWRLLSLVAHEPIYGYGNQYDMARTSACLDLWPAASISASDAEIARATAAAPLSDYQIKRIPEQPCYYSSEAAWDKLVLSVRALVSENKSVDLRLIGLSKALALLLSACFCAALLWKYPRAAVFHALIFCGVVCDPHVTLYANSLYTEFTAVWGAYLFLGSFAAYTLGHTGTGRFPLSAFGVCLGMLLLSCSRVPNAALSVVLCMTALFYLWRWRASGVFALVLLLSSGAGVLLGISNQKNSESIAQANAANTLLYTFLPASNAPAELMQRLALPQSCKRYGFSSWYLARGVVLSESCSQIYRFSRARLIQALWFEPMIAGRVLANAFAQSRGWRARYMGEVGGGDYARAKHPSFADYAPTLPYFAYVFGLFLALMLGMAVVLLPTLLLSSSQRERACWRCLQSLNAMFCLVLILPLLISLIGDGYTELPRHAHLSTVISLPLLLLGFVGVVTLVRESERRIVVASGVLLAISAALVCSAMLTRQGSALGVWDHALWAGGRHQIAGTVIDPYGIDVVYARAAAQATQPLSIRVPGRDLRQVFQGYPDSSLVQGTIEVHAPYTEIVVRNRLGVETVVDRIWPMP